MLTINALAEIIKKEGKATIIIVEFLDIVQVSKDKFNLDTRYGSINTNITHTRYQNPAELIRPLKNTAEPTHFAGYIFVTHALRSITQQMFFMVEGVGRVERVESEYPYPTLLSLPCLL